MYFGKKKAIISRSPRSNPTANSTGTLDWQSVESCLALLDPFLVHQLFPFGVIKSVHQPDRPFTNTSDCADVPCRSWLSEKVGGEINCASGDGDGTSSIRDAELACLSDYVTADRLNVRREIEMIAVTTEEVFCPRGGVPVVVAVGRRTGGEVESLLEGFVALPEGLFRHLCEFADLSETTGDVSLATGDEDASGDNSLHRLSSEKFFFVRAFVHLLGYIANRLRERKLLAHGRDVTEGREYVSFGPRAVGSRGRSLKFARDTRTTVTEADHSVELLNALHQGIRGSSNTGRVVPFVVREGLHVADPRDSIKHC